MLDDEQMRKGASFAQELEECVENSDLLGEQRILEESRRQVCAPVYLYMFFEAM